MKLEMGITLKTTQISLDYFDKKKPQTLSFQKPETTQILKNPL